MVKYIFTDKIITYKSSLLPSLQIKVTIQQHQNHNLKAAFTQRKVCGKPQITSSITILEVIRRASVEYFVGNAAAGSLWYT